MANNNNRWPSPSQAYTGSNYGEQLQPESGVGPGNGVREEPPVVINNGSNDNNNGNRNTIVFGDRKPYMFLPSTKDMWETVKETYSDIQNSSQIFGLKSKLCHAKQEDSVLFLKRQENDSVFVFLVGLNKDLDEVGGRVLGKVSLSTLRETFAEIRRQEKKKSGRAFRDSNSDQGHQPPPSQFPLTTEQLDRLYELLESPTLSCSIATKGNSVFLSGSPNHT
ncbi:hypothetical protein KIW84_056558 [Lathyrus oleraceus]|uniref:Uncharacterized protein n=1 Tax=Pisum sativum TaxID=3888 RepID=A0A9D5AJU8_PEA|nr:hypothetical protein KIW84_056558 [Pisum sativum]